MQDRIIKAVETKIVGSDDDRLVIHAYITRRFAYMPSSVHNELLAMSDERLSGFAESFYNPDIRVINRLEMFIHDVCRFYEDLVQGDK